MNRKREGKKKKKEGTGYTGYLFVALDAEKQDVKEHLRCYFQPTKKLLLGGTPNWKSICTLYDVISRAFQCERSIFASFFIFSFFSPVSKSN